MDPIAAKHGLIAMVDIDWHRAIQEGLDSSLVDLSTSSSELLILWQEQRLPSSLESLWGAVDWKTQTLRLPINIGLPELFELHFSVAVKLVNRYMPTEIFAFGQTSFNVILNAAPSSGSCSLIQPAPDDASPIFAMKTIASVQCSSWIDPTFAFFSAMAEAQNETIPVEALQVSLQLHSIDEDINGEHAVAETRSIGRTALQNIDNPTVKLDFTLPHGTWAVWASIRSPIISGLEAMSNIVMLDVEEVVFNGSSRECAAVLRAYAASNSTQPKSNSH